MKSYYKVLIAAATMALTLSSVPSLAATQKVDTDKLPMVKCIDLRFSIEFLDRHPKAPAACLEAREYKGAKYAKFQGKVTAKTADTMTVSFLNVAGDPLSSFTFTPPAGGGVMIEGKKTPYKDVKVGEKLTFWVQEGQRFRIYAAPGMDGADVTK
jgi:hypothetical protein